MNPPLQSRIRVPMLTAMVILASLLTSQPIECRLMAQEPEQTSDSQNADSKSSDSKSTLQNTDPQDPIQELFKQLDSPSFKAREAATERLINSGPKVLKPLAVQFFSSSSEAGWRLHRVLEGIGKSGDEADFLKSVALIQLLYGAQDSQSQGRLAGLQFGWMSARRTEAARKLNERGFSFASSNAPVFRDADADRIRIEIMLRDLEMRDRRGFEIATSAEVEDKKVKTPTPSPWVNPRLDQQESILKAENIINGSADENRKLVETTLAPSFRPTLPPGELEFPEGWKGDEDSLKLIKDLGSLSSLTFQEQNIDDKLQKYISEQKALTSLKLINCKFSKGADKLSLPAAIASLEFTGSLPPPASFRSLEQVRTLKLSKVKLDEDVAYAISKRKIQSIDLEEVEFTQLSIKRLVNMRGLFRVSVSLCKFDLEWLAEIRRKNQSIIVARPQAFLGVQGPVPVVGTNLTGCQISEIVSGQAAARAGMQPLDIVTAVDGQKVVVFEDLRLLISQKHPGDSMRLEVQRGDETLKLKVDLGEMTPSIR